MSGFTESVLEQKLKDLNNSAQSIQQLSLWLIHHKKHYKAIVKIWHKEILNVQRDKKLTFLYLANDVVQNSKKKFPNFSVEFGNVMKKVMEHLAVLPLDEKTIKSIHRLLNIWKERGIFDTKIQTDLNRIWATKSLEAKTETKDKSANEGPEAKRARKESSKKKVRVSVEKTPSKKVESEEKPAATPMKSAADILQSLLSPSDNSPSHSASNADPPDPEELIKALQDLEHTASADAEIRDKISKFPLELSDPSYLENLNDSDEAKKLLSQAEEADRILTEYNERLQQELKERKRVGKMISDFLVAQKDLEQIAEGRLEEFRDKLEKVNNVRSELKSHIQSLPDLTKLPDVTGGLAPLPSVGDLFTVK